MSGSSCVWVEHVTVRPDRIVADIRIADEACVLTSEDMIDKALCRYPHLLDHACVNNRGETFGAVASRTSVAHLVEHMAIEGQARVSSGAKSLFVGKTSWANRAKLLARVEISYEDDLVALASLRAAVLFADYLLAEREGARFCVGEAPLKTEKRNGNESAGCFRIPYNG